MSIKKHFLATVLFLLGCNSALATGLGQHESECYSVAMVGYDSVINSNLGLPLDQVINTLVEHNNDTENTLEIYREYLLLVVMEAYQWEGTPHMYAARTMYHCAAKHAEIAAH